jgi:hypothetical protein
MVVHRATGAVGAPPTVPPRAGEMIQEYALALEHGLTLGDLARTIHVYPTYGFATQQAAAEYTVATLFGGVRGALLKAAGRLLRG